MKQNSFATGFIVFFIITFMALWAQNDFGTIDIYGFVLLCIPCGFVGFLGGAIATVIAKNKKDE